MKKKPAEKPVPKQSPPIRGRGWDAGAEYYRDLLSPEVRAKLANRKNSS